MRAECKQWLGYSQSKDAAFCFICRCLGSLVGFSVKQFIDVGFRTWSKALGGNGTFSKHLKSRMDMLSSERHLLYTTSKNVDEQL